VIFEWRFRHQTRAKLRSVKPEHGSNAGPIVERLATLLQVFSPWEDISLTYRQFAAEIGAPVTEAAVKKWPQRKKFPADVARAIVARARERGLVGVTRAAKGSEYDPKCPDKPRVTSPECAGRTTR
jgi:hypothetical protein